MEWHSALYDAMFNTGCGSGLGTNEAELYAVLSSLGRDATKIQSLKAAYQKKYGHDLRRICARS
ncbi:MAG: hypothetical protein IPN95_19300 [Bacteroidetes bacterium]|nr:hypothetical protein [Bacteroidota bacterium]